MTNTLKLNHENRTIVMDRTFAKYAEDTRSKEYAHLQQVRRDYPTYQVIQRHIKRKEDKRTYKGLTYLYMEDYILTHGTKEEREKNYREFEEIILISKCHSQAFRYPVVKSWFLERYPEIMEFGLKEKEGNVILQMPKNNEDEIVEKKYA